MKLFGKWDATEVKIKDAGLVPYLNLSNQLSLHTFGSVVASGKQKEHINVVERLINKLMRSGQGKKKLGGKFYRGRENCGKKLLSIKAVDNAFDIIHTKTKKNPVQVLIDAIENSTPNEDVTRITKGGVASAESVDIAPIKKLDEALKNIVLATFANTFNTKNTFENVLADEIILASQKDQKSYAIKRKDEIERIAKSSR
jgi:small subunit ribosomal protein S7